MNTIERTDKIDAYLAGSMSDKEKKEFEGLLSDPETSLEDRTKLQDEMELQKEIIHAIRRRGFREMVQKDIAEINKEKEEADKKAAKITPLYRRVLRVSASLAIAACFIGVIIIAPQVNRLSNIGDNANLYASVNIEMNEAYSGLKGCNDATNAILEANELMQSGDYKQADKILAHALEQMEPITSDEQQAWTEKEDMLYLRALCVIKQHKLYRSRMLLNEVINMNSMHKDQAQQLLNQIKGRQ
jgi:hypothetical protein